MDRAMKRYPVADLEQEPNHEGPGWVLSSHSWKFVASMEAVIPDDATKDGHC